MNNAPSEGYQELLPAIESYLASSLPPADRRPSRLHAAMRYAVLAGGKRVRPALCLAAARACGGTVEDVLPAACAIELLHTYTLVHDDLPSMDDDDLRRGRPTLHKAFDEATAILAGDALLTLSFEWIAGTSVPSPYPANQLILELARASGSEGVIAGQMEDLAAEGQPPDPDVLAYIHRHKTGALIHASVRIGGIAAGATAGALEALDTYGQSAGLAFQIVDDILNATGDSARMGKATGTDAALGKLTYATLYGVERARSEAARLLDEAMRAIAMLQGPKRALAELAELFRDRLH